jgi:hypothetical protein
VADAATPTAEALRARIRTYFIRPPNVQRGGHRAEDDLFPGVVVLTEVPAPRTAQPLRAAADLLAPADTPKDPS